MEDNYLLALLRTWVKALITGIFFLNTIQGGWDSLKQHEAPTIRKCQWKFKLLSFPKSLKAAWKAGTKFKIKLLELTITVVGALGGTGFPLSFISRVKFHCVVRSKWLPGKLMMESFCLPVSARSFLYKNQMVTPLRSIPVLEAEFWDGSRMEQHIQERLPCFDFTPAQSLLLVTSERQRDLHCAQGTCG